MSKIRYKIEFLSDWHCGSGLSSGSDVDLLCVKDEYGLPFVPGRTLKGLLHEASKVVWGDKDLIKTVFGDSTNRTTIENDGGTEITEQGCCYFSNGELSKTIKEHVKDKTDILYRKISSTAIDEHGMAKEHSLRRMEVAVPITLYGEIADIPSEESREMLIKSMKFIKRLGVNRNRGLGRCVLEEII